MNKFFKAASLVAFAVVVTGCASTAPEYDPAATYVVVPKDNNERQYQNDVNACKSQTSQRHIVRTQEQFPNQVDCLVQMGHKLVKKGNVVASKDALAGL